MGKSKGNKDKTAFSLSSNNTCDAEHIICGCVHDDNTL